VQLINPMKCTMLFGVDCPVSAQDKVKEILNMPNITVEEKYLGLPMPEGCMNKDNFVMVKERLINRHTN
jgi:hypothetical protein